MGWYARLADKLLERIGEGREISKFQMRYQLRLRYF